MSGFLRRYQPVQVQRFRDSYGLGLNRAVTRFPFPHFGLFCRQTYATSSPLSRAKSPLTANSNELASDSGESNKGWPNHDQ